MGDFLSKLAKLARQTAQPYAFTVRAAVAYIVLAGLVLLSLSLARLAILSVGSSGSRVSDYFRAIVDHLAAALVISIVAALLLLFLNTKNQADSDLRAIEPWNIHTALVDALASTRTYWFRGRSGRFLRDVVLPTLAENARKESTQRSVHLLLPDPGDDQTMARYADYRNSISNKEEWTPDRIKIEIIATILRAAELSCGNQFLEVNASISNNFALYRSDMSDACLIMTREEEKWPALMCASGSVFYDSFLEEMRIAHKLGKILEYAILPFGTKAEKANVSTLIRTLGLDGIELTDEQCTNVVEAMRRKSNPYG